MAKDAKTKTGVRNLESALEEYKEIERRIAPYTKPRTVSEPIKQRKWRSDKISTFPNQKELVRRLNENINRQA